MTQTTITPPTQAAVAALRARDVNGAEKLLELATPDAVLGACRWYDDQRQQGMRVRAGLLVSCIREGGKPGYGEKPAELLKPITPRLLQAVRGRCLSPDGARRSEVLDMFEDAAKRRGVTAVELVDQAMGPHWQLTPPHPALLQHADGKRWERYGRWVSAGGQSRPDLAVERGVGELVLSFCSRFWRWEDA